MTFRDWIGTQKGKDPGAGPATIMFIQGRQKLLNECQRRQKHSTKDYQDLVNYLTEILFPKTDSSNQYQQFLKNLITLYNKTTENKVLDTFNLINSVTYINPQDINNLEALEAQVKRHLKEMKEKSYRKEQSLRKLLADANDALKNYEIIIQEAQTLGKNIKRLEAIKRRMTSLSQTINIEMNAITKKMENNQRVSPTKFNDDLFFDGRSITFSTFRKQVNNLQGLITSIATFSPLDDITIGKIWEFALAMIGTNYKLATDTIPEQLVDNFISEIQKNITGGNNIRRSSKTNIVNFKTDVFKQYSDHIISEGIKNKQATINVNGVQIQYSVNKNGLISSIDAGSKAQGKMDVRFTLPTVPGSNYAAQPFKISAKNWSSLKDRDFGSTTLLRAFLRTSNHASVLFIQKSSSLIENYIYALQTPDYAVMRTNVLQQAQNYAKCALAADIISGYSQRFNQGMDADTGVILDRAAQRVIVIDFYHLLSQDNSVINITYSGATQDDLRAKAIKIREEILYSNINTNRSIAYKQLMLLLLNNINASAKLRSLNSKAIYT